MADIRSFINKVKEKNILYQQNQKEKSAQAKGFSSARAYDVFAGAAKSEGEESAKSELRKKELNRIKAEAKEEAMSGRYGKYDKYQKKIAKGFETFKKGTNVYNDIMGEFQSMSSGNDSFYPKQNSSQGYASGYGVFAKPQRRKSTTKKTKSKRKSHSKPKSFMDQFMY